MSKKTIREMNIEVYPVLDAHLNSGMTLADYFAGQAIAGLYASARKEHGWSDDPHVLSTLAWDCAVSMLQERERRGI